MDKLFNSNIIGALPVHCILAIKILKFIISTAIILNRIKEKKENIMIRFGLKESISVVCPVYC